MSSYKIVVIGVNQVGRTSILDRWIGRQFREVIDFDPALDDDDYFKLQVVDGKTINLSVTDYRWDESLDLYQTPYLEQLMRSANGFIFVYDVTSRGSFEIVQEFHHEALAVKDDDHVPIVLVANKCDLEDKRVVRKEEGQDCAQQWLGSYIETSAKTNQNIDECFCQIVREIECANNSNVPSVQNNNHYHCIMM